MTLSRTPLTTEDADLRGTLLAHASLIAEHSRGTASWQYASIYALVLAQGVFCPTSFAPVNRGMPKHCYRNAFQLATGDTTLRYCEGFAFAASFPFPFDHAWCVNERDEIVEPTWVPPGTAYLGICLKTTYVQEQVLRQGIYGLLCDPRTVMPFLQQGIPPEALAYKD